MPEHFKRGVLAGDTARPRGTSKSEMIGAIRVCFIVRHRGVVTDFLTGFRSV